MIALWLVAGILAKAGESVVQPPQSQQLGGGFKRVYLIKRKKAERSLVYAERRAEQAQEALEKQAQKEEHSAERAARQASLSAAKQSIERARSRLEIIEQEAINADIESQAAKVIVQNEVLKAKEAVIAARLERDKAELAYQTWLAEEEIVISMFLAA